MQNYVKKVVMCHVTYFQNFGITSISRERLKPETPNLGPKLDTGVSNEKNAKLSQKENFKFGTQIGHWGTKQ